MLSETDTSDEEHHLIDNPPLVVYDPVIAPVVNPLISHKCGVFTLIAILGAIFVTLSVMSFSKIYSLGGGASWGAAVFGIPTITALFYKMIGKVLKKCKIPCCKYCAYITVVLDYSLMLAGVIYLLVRPVGGVPQWEGTTCDDVPNDNISCTLVSTLSVSSICQVRGILSNLHSKTAPIYFNYNRWWKRIISFIIRALLVVDIRPFIRF